MAHLVKDLEDIQVQWTYKDGGRSAELISIDPETGDIESVKISTKAAEMLVEHGMSSGS